MKFFIKQAGKMVLQHLFLPFVYRIGCLVHRRVQENVVVFADAHHNEIPFSMEAMYQTVAARGYSCRLHLYDYSHESGLRALCHSVSFMFLYSGARYVFLCDNFLPVSSCKKRPETMVIQLWHSCGLLKKMGYDTSQDVPDFYRGNVYRNYDLVTVSASCCEPFLTSGMRQPKGVVRALGVSRTDVYFDRIWRETCIEEFYSRFPHTRGKKVILWAPTFRGNAAQPQISGLEEIKRLEKKLGEEWLVLIQVHPHLEQKALRDTGRPLSTCSIPTEHLFPVTDLLITDYSSALFDYLLFEKPFVLFAPDLQAYQTERGFYIEYDSLTPYVATEEAALYKAVQQAYKGWESGRDMESLRACRRKYCAACDGKAAARIAEYLEMRTFTC